MLERFKINKFNALLAVVFCGLLSMGNASLQSQTPDNSTSKYAVKTVVIDAGHGGKDDGAMGFSGKKEKNIALAVALKLGAYIQQNCPDVKVIYTRKTDVFVELHERAAIANRAKADLFISIHLNSSTNSDAYGCEAWVLGLHRSESNLEVAKRENSVIKLEDQFETHYEFDPNSEAGHIIMSMAQSAYLEQSIDLASKVIDQFENKIKRKSRGVKQAGFMVLYKTAMPAILIELGFISNQEEEHFMGSEDGQDFLASAIYRAFRDYKRIMESRANGGKAAPSPGKTDSLPVKTDNEYRPINPVKSTTTTSTISNPPAPVKSTAEKPSTTNEKVNDPSAPVKIITDKPGLDRTLYHSSNSTNHEIKTVKTTADSIANAKNQAPVDKDKPLEKEVIAANTSLVFHIQFCAAVGKAAPGSKYLRDFPKIQYEDNGKGVLRYMTGNFSSYAEAKAELPKVIAKGYKDAFIVVYKDGIRADIRNYQK